ALMQVTERQYVVAGSKADTDVVGFYSGAAKSCFVVLHYIGGTLLGKDFEIIETPVEEEAEAISGLLRQYYQGRGVYPRTICVPADLPDAVSLERLFTETCGHRVYIEAPKRGEKARLIETAQLNAREETERVTTREEKTLKTLEWLQKALQLPAIPERMEAFDISNTGGSDIVASMTVFVKGRPLKRDYRRFKIKTLEGQDDYHSMMEVVSRRIIRYKEGDEKFSPLPDLMLIDGGATHAAAAESVLMREGVSVPVCGMVKDGRHRTRALVLPDGQEIGISSNPAVFALIGTIQEETHRFAIEYHRSLRTKSTVASKLDGVEGVGPKRRENLLKRFGSLKGILSASVEELSEVVPKAVAQRILEQLGSQSGAGEKGGGTAGAGEK
ncbi:MAG TPA: excinuclease ABC subunit UvrC, partial [Papillibacter sp.]|nr:excinuclease ABC subunit UvrC [Papillibacter sp.]